MFIVLELFPDAEQATIVVVPETGWNKIFETEDDAQIEAANCQNGIVIEVN